MKKMSSKELREQAKRLLEKAKIIELENTMNLGKKAVELSKEGKLQPELQKIVDSFEG